VNLNRERFERALEYLRLFLKGGVRPSDNMPMRPDWVRFVSYRGVRNKGSHERNATSQDLPILAYPGHSRLPRWLTDLALSNIRTRTPGRLNMKGRRVMFAHRFENVTSRSMNTHLSSRDIGNTSFQRDVQSLADWKSVQAFSTKLTSRNFEMPSNDATLNHERERTQRYAHRGAAGNHADGNDIIRDERDSRDERDGRDDTLHLPNGDAPHRLEQGDDASQTSHSEQEHGKGTSMSNGDLMYSQYDDSYESDNILQQLRGERTPSRGEDDYRKNWYDANPEPRRSDTIHCTHNEYERCTDYLWRLSRDKRPLQEEMSCIIKKRKCQRGHHGLYDNELPNRNNRGRAHFDLMKSARRNKREQYGTICGHNKDKVCTGPSWCLPRKGLPFQTQRKRLSWMRTVF
jgi:hypothetical protein